MKVRTRYEDMSRDGYLQIAQDEDGDIHVTVRETDEQGFASASSVEFCASGTRSPKTYQALLGLIMAMESEDRIDGIEVANLEKGK